MREGAALARDGMWHAMADEGAGRHPGEREGPGDRAGLEGREDPEEAGEPGGPGGPGRPGTAPDGPGRAVRGPLPVLAAEVRAFVHSTEDAERVRACVRALAGESAEVRETRSRGYHHQPLRVLEAEVRDRAGLRRLLGLLRTDEVRSDYGRTWPRRLDEEHGTVHFRLAKQPLLQGVLRLEPPDGSGDLVKVELRLQAFPARPERYREIARGLLD